MKKINLALQKILIILFLFWSRSLISEGFTAGTLVKTAHGYVPIECIKPGDSVLCLNDKGQLTKSSVLNIKASISYQPITINTDTSSIITDHEQLFCVISPQRWIQADTLNTSNQLLNCSYELISIRSLYSTDQQINTYALSVQEYHNFFVSRDDILVHNWLVLTPVAVELIPPAIVTATKIATGVSVVAGLIYTFFWEISDQPKHDGKPANSKNGGDEPCWCGHKCGPLCLCNCYCNCGRNNQSKQNVTSHPNGIYEDTDYHHQNSKGNSDNGKSPSPRNGQKALDNSIKVPGDGNGRAGVSEGEIVILYQTSISRFHGFVIKWEEMKSNPWMQQLMNDMIKAGLIDNRGNILR